MIQKKYLPYRFSRRGWAPDTLILQRTADSVDECYHTLEREHRIAHYHISPTGTVTVFAPISYAARAVPESGFPYRTPPNDDLRGILLLLQGENSITERQDHELRQLTERLKDNLYRTYGWTGELTVKDGTQNEEVRKNAPCLFRVQTGCYADQRDAEESLERLRAAGLAGYITRIRRDGSEGLL